MFKYFDRDFFKFSIGFVTIISVSLLIILATKFYQEKLVLNEDNSTSLIQVIEKK